MSNSTEEQVGLWVSMHIRGAGMVSARSLSDGDPEFPAVAFGTLTCVCTCVCVYVRVCVHVCVE